MQLPQLLGQAVCACLLTTKNLSQETGFRLTGPHRRVAFRLGFDQPLTHLPQLLLKLPDQLGQLLGLSLGSLMSKRVSRIEQLGRKLNKDLTKVAAALGQLATLGPCPERFLVQP